MFGSKMECYTEYPNEDNDEEETKSYNFRVLLPNGTSVGLTLNQISYEMSIKGFLKRVRNDYERNLEDDDSRRKKRKIDWDSQGVYLEDVVDGYILSDKIVFRRYEQKHWHLLKLHDGQENPSKTFENMWDVTPDTSKLLDPSFTCLTALDNLIGNSLQAVWSNDTNESRMISVEVEDDRISILDNGAGMDASAENSIANWGKMGLPLHSSSKKQDIGGKPPYLWPFFGMLGYGGPVASMRLGRHTVVSSKMRSSNKVYILDIEREALLHGSSEMSWKISGGLRDTLDDDLSSSRHGSFTKVEILEPERASIDALKLKYRLKDIFSPYIQYDDTTTGKTLLPVEFKVNGEDLSKIEGGEVAITNLHSCNGPEFSLQLLFSYKNSGTSRSPGSTSVAANARLKCVYFPVREGKESFDRILEDLEADKCGISENFDTFCRVSIRRLGRLLPDARWPRLPFMGLKHRKGDKDNLLKRCSLRVKCFIDTDAGFRPTPAQNDLAQHHQFTTALKNFGCELLEEGGVKIEIHRHQKALSLPQLEEEYEKWILQMHDAYDEELECGQDQPVLVVNPANKEGLGISSNVIRVQKSIKRKGKFWKAGNFVKIIPWDNLNEIYATLEFILLEGSEGDAGGKARLICRPIDVPAEKGCSLKFGAENMYLDLQHSLSYPVSVIESGEVDTSEWKHQYERLQFKAPSSIDLRSAQHCRQLENDGIDFALDEINGSNAICLCNDNIIVIAAECSEVQKEAEKRTYDRFRKFGSNIITCMSSGASVADVAIKDHNDEFLKLNIKDQSGRKAEDIAKSLAELSKKEMTRQGFKSGLVEICTAGREIKINKKKKTVSLSAWISTSRGAQIIQKYRCFGSLSSLYAESVVDNMYEEDMLEEEMIEVALKAVFMVSYEQGFYGDSVQVCSITKDGIKEVKRISFEGLVKKYDTFDQQKLIRGEGTSYEKGYITTKFRELRERRRREQ